MDEPTSNERRGYSNVQLGAFLRRGMSILSSRLSRGALILTVMLASVALFSIKHVTLPNRVHVPLADHAYGVHSISDALRSFTTNNAYGPKAWNRRHSSAVSQYMRKPVIMRSRPRIGASDSHSPTLSLMLRPETACGSSVEDFVELREVPTGDCKGGRTCRARVIVTKKGSHISIQAGYNIFYANGVVDVGPRTKRNVKAVNRAEADKWANKLVLMLGAVLEGLNCDVTANVISDAIMETKSAAAQCPNTGDARCTQLRTVKTCTVAAAPPAQSEQENECMEFLASETPISSLDDLTTKSPCATWFEYNSVYMRVPLCEAMCVGDACVQEKTIFGDLDVFGYLLRPRYDRSDNVNIRNSIAAVFVTLYNTLIGANFPRCDNMTYGVLEPEWEEEGFQLLVATHKVSSISSEFSYIIPKEIQDIAAENYGGYVLDVRYAIANDPVEYVEAQCNTLE